MARRFGLAVGFALAVFWLAGGAGGAGPAADPRAGGLIAFVSERGGNTDVYVMAADGSKQRRLTRHPAIDESPSWSPDGKRIVFTSSRDGNHELYVMGADGTGQRRLTRNPAYDYYAAWSPDGKQIAFTRGSKDDELYVMAADGSGQRRLTRHPAYDYTPAWSPDSERLSFTSNRDGNIEVYVMTADGCEPQRLTRNPAADFHAVWSPDGERIAFTSERDGIFNIYVMAADGSRQRRVTPRPAGTPAWSPDGNRIAFTTSRDGNDEVYVMAADGSGQRRLTRHPADDSDPVWQPAPRRGAPAPIPSSSSVGSTAPDTRLMVLRLADLPSTFVCMTGHYESNTQARARSASKRDFDALGRLSGYAATFGKSGRTGLVWLGSEASLYRSPARAHSSFLDGAKLLENGKTVKFERLAVGAPLGHEARVYKTTITERGSKVDAHLLVWRSGAVVASIIGTSVAGTADPADLVAFGVKQQARINAAKR